MMAAGSPPMPSAGHSVTVGGLLRARSDASSLGLELLAGQEGLGRPILSPYVLKTGLALAGFDAYLQPGRVLVFGASELGYLASLAPEARVLSLARTLRHDIPCVLVTDGNAVPDELPIAAERAAVPVLRTRFATPIAIAKLTNYLEDILAERTILHAVLIDLLGLGVLIVGESGIGKSECALDLVLRGHRLVADDTVEVRRRAESVLIGTCPELTRFHMEIRGLGVINVKDLFGVASTRSSKRVELVVQLERWEAGRQYDTAWPRRRVLRHPGPESAADPHARRSRSKRGKPGGGCRAKPVAAFAGVERRPAAGRTPRSGTGRRFRGGRLGRGRRR